MCAGEINPFNGKWNSIAYSFSWLMSHILLCFNLTALGKAKIINLGDGLYKLEASDQIPIVHSVHLYVITFRNIV